MRYNEFFESKYNNQDALAIARDELKLNIVSQALNIIHKSNLTIKNTPGLEELLNNYKHIIIRYILYYFKIGANKRDMLVTSNLMIKKLKATKINWPEISIMEQSIEAEVNRSLNLLKGQ
jgi:hypothetical protein